MANALRVGIAGLGTVGIGALKILNQRANELTLSAGRPIRVTAVASRDRTRDRGIDVSQYLWFENPVEMAGSPEIDIFVETIGGAEGPAHDAVKAALKAGKPVVTANKALLAKHGAELARLAETNGVAIAFEPAAAGGIPVIKALKESLVGNRITRVSGIMNGTCNYILSRMEAEGLSFAECLKDAQRLGYAEADPTFDVEGFDTAHKLALLTSLAFGTEVDSDSIYVEGISGVTPLDLKMADELGFRIKLLGVAERTSQGIEQRVHPTMVPKTSQLAQVMGVLNAVSIQADPVGELTFVGPGAGAGATGSAVVGDILDIARGANVATFGRSAGALEKPVRAPIRQHEGGYYIRMDVKDVPGAAARIATRMAERGISLESILQKGSRDRSTGGTVPVVLITYATSEAKLREALSDIAGDGVLEGDPQAIRIER
ncbi:MAG: homoserine dehydrogenase [Proteobacteria bacterium]|nr:homoserine dehydrogenase [Pseudomonadota bacterium]